MVLYLILNWVNWHVLIWVVTTDGEFDLKSETGENTPLTLGPVQHEPPEEVTKNEDNADVIEKLPEKGELSDKADPNLEDKKGLADNAATPAATSYSDDEFLEG